MYRRIFAIALLTAVFCCTISVPRADEPPADSLAKYLPADSTFYCLLPDTGSTLTRIKELALYKFIEEGKLLKEGADSANKFLSSGGFPGFDVERVMALIAEARDPLAAAFTGRAEIAIPEYVRDSPSIVFAFKVQDGCDDKAREALTLILEKLGKSTTPPGILNASTSEYKGVNLTALMDSRNPQESECPWLCVTNGFALFAIGKATICGMVDRLAQPPERNLLGLASFRKGYSAATYKDLWSYVSVGSALRNSPEMSQEIASFLGKETGGFENASIFYGVSLNGLYVEDELLVELNGGAWPVPFDLLSSESPCACASASLFPEDTAFYVCHSMTPASLIEAARRAGYFGLDVEALKKREFDVESDLMPLLGPEVGMGSIVRSLLPLSAYAFEMKDPEKVKTMLSDMAGRMKDVFGEPTTYNGSWLVASKSLRIPWTYAACAIALKGKWLLIGPLEIIKVLADANGGDLSANRDYVSAVPPLLSGQPQTAGFVNFRSLVRVFYPILLQFLQGSELVKDMPPIERVIELAVPGAFSVKMSGEGARLSAKGPIALSATFTMSATAALERSFQEKRRADEAAALEAVKSFGGAAMRFAHDNLDKTFWENGTTNFDPYCTDSTPRFGYTFAYFSNDTNGNGISEATEFVYMAIPAGTEPDRPVFYVDETMALFTVIPGSAQQLKAVQEIREPSIQWIIKHGSRISLPGLYFHRR
ncbi:MAG: hypothetical protein WC712_11445 [Candidatus Brocadiia bacterium]